MVGLRRLSEGDEDCTQKVKVQRSMTKPKKISYRLLSYLQLTLSCFFSWYFFLWDYVSTRATATSMRAWWVCEDCRREMKIVTQKVKVQRSMTKPKKISFCPASSFFLWNCVSLAERQLRACAHGGSANTVGGRWRLSHKKSKYREACMTKPKKISYNRYLHGLCLASSLATFSSFEIVCLAERQLRACAHGGSAKTVGGRWRLSHKKSKYREAWPNQRRLAI